MTTMKGSTEANTELRTKVHMRRRRWRSFCSSVASLEKKNISILVEMTKRTIFVRYRHLLLLFVVREAADDPSE